MWGCVARAPPPIHRDRAQKSRASRVGPRARAVATDVGGGGGVGGDVRWLACKLEDDNPKRAMRLRDFTFAARALASTTASERSAYNEDSKEARRGM